MKLLRNLGVKVDSFDVTEIYLWNETDRDGCRHPRYRGIVRSCPREVRFWSWGVLFGFSFVDHSSSVRLPKARFG